MGQIEIVEGSDKITIDDPLARKKDKVCIIGFADTHKAAPYDDDSFEFWGVNEMHLVPTIKKIDVLFELHDYKWIAEDKKIKGHIAWLRQNRDVPVFMQQHYPDIPLSIPFPRAEVLAKFRNYFTNTISWEIALAIMLGFKEIRLYGVNMANDVEYASQRPSCEYYLGLAEGMGIKTYLPPESDLLKTMYQYGFEDGELSMMAAKMKAYIAEQDAGYNFAQNQINQGVAQMNQRLGAKHSAEYFLKAFVYPNTNFAAEKKG